jgi:hypothetical protein
MSPENLSRRAILAGAASVPALALPAVAASASTDPDPIFAAIERWKELDAVEQAAFEARDKAIEACDERYGTLISAMSKEGRQFFEANVFPLVKAQDEASHRRFDATRAIFETVPTTLGGMRAKIDFAFREDYVTDLLLRGHTDEPVQNFLNTLYEGARLVAVQS